jgi:hypothetical protein
MYQDKFTNIVIALLAIVFLVGTCGRGGCVQQDVARRALENAGYTEVQITDHKWFAVSWRGCGNDAARFDATAKNPKGDYVDVYVCAGWLLKGSTIRSE